MGGDSFPHNDSHAVANVMLSLSSRDSSTRAVICKRTNRGVKRRRSGGAVRRTSLKRLLHSKFVDDDIATKLVAAISAKDAHLIDSWVPERLPTPQKCRH